MTDGSGYAPIDQGVGHWFGHMILPWTVLALLYMAIYARLTRNNLLETLGEDYIRTARAKGLSERKVILKHGLRASLTPIVTIFGLDMALLVGGAIITESVFNIQGLGWLAINGAITQDLPTVLGVVICTATAVAIANLVVDIIYAFLDPRVRGSHDRRRAPSSSGARRRRSSTSATSPSASAPATASCRRSRTSRSRSAAARRSASSASRAPGKSVTSLAIMGLLNRAYADIDGEILFEGRDLLKLEARRAAQDPRPRRLDDLPGPVRLPAPDVPGRRPDRRGGARAPGRLEEGRDRPARSSCSARSGSRTPRSARATTRTSSRAACASAR